MEGECVDDGEAALVLGGVLADSVSGVEVMAGVDSATEIIELLPRTLELMLWATGLVDETTGGRELEAELGRTFPVLEAVNRLEAPTPGHDTS